jgi:hypothetical protein
MSVRPQHQRRTKCGRCAWPKGCGNCSLELMDCRRQEEDLTDEELHDLVQFEEDEEVRLKAENPPDPQSGEESISFKGEETVALKKAEEPSEKHLQSRLSPPSTGDKKSPSPSTNYDKPDYEKEYNDLLDWQDA